MAATGSLPLPAALAVLAAAFAHASWNAIAHGSRDRLLAFALLGAGGLLLSVPLAAGAAAPAGPSRPGCTSPTCCC
jgi:hypothetical protein